MIFSNQGNRVKPYGRERLWNAVWFNNKWSIILSNAYSATTGRNSQKVKSPTLFI